MFLFRVAQTSCVGKEIPCTTELETESRCYRPELRWPGGIECSTFHLGDFLCLICAVMLEPRERQEREGIQEGVCLLTAGLTGIGLTAKTHKIFCILRLPGSYFGFQARNW